MVDELNLNSVDRFLSSLNKYFGECGKVIAHSATARIHFSIFVIVFACFYGNTTYSAEENPVTKAAASYNLGSTLASKSFFIEALDLLEESRDLYREVGLEESSFYADVLFSIAQTKIRARLEQDFPAFYVKSALIEIQNANRLRERLKDVAPQQLSAGYYLEGYIQKRFFMRRNAAIACFNKAIGVDPGAFAAKRELSELIVGDESK